MSALLHVLVLQIKKIGFHHEAYYLGWASTLLATSVVTRSGLFSIGHWSGGRFRVAARPLLNGIFRARGAIQFRVEWKKARHEIPFYFVSETRPAALLSARCASGTTAAQQKRWKMIGIKEYGSLPFFFQLNDRGLQFFPGRSGREQLCFDTV